MTLELRVVCQEDCGNAPRKAILRDFTIALVRKDLILVQDWLSKNIVWNIIGESRLVGMDQVLDHIFNSLTVKPLELQINHIITHGKTASLNGSIKLEKDKDIEFCDVYEFVGAGKNAKIKEITSYRI